MRISVLIGSALLLAALTAGCQPVQPESAMPAEAATAPAAPEMATLPTVFVLPDGTVCNFAGEGATLGFAEGRLNHACGDPEAMPMIALLGDPVQDDMQGSGVWTASLATISHGDDGFTLDSSETITFFAAEIDLADESVCLHAGFGATLGFENKRLNYTCGEIDAGSTGIIGDLTYDAAAMPGVYVAQKVLFHSAGDAGWALDKSAMLDVTRIVGQDMPQK